MSNEITLKIKADQKLPDNNQWTNRFEIKSESSNRKYIISQNIDKRHWGCSCPGWRTGEVQAPCNALSAVFRAPIRSQAGNNQIAMPVKIDNTLGFKIAQSVPQDYGAHSVMCGSGTFGWVCRGVYPALHLGGQVECIHKHGGVIEFFFVTNKEIHASRWGSDKEIEDTVIAPVLSEDSIPEGTRCQEASVMSRNRYIPCGAPATAIVHHDKDRRSYYMCAACTDHNVRNRGGKLVFQKSKGA